MDGITLADMKSYYKTVVIKIVWHGTRWANWTHSLEEGVEKQSHASRTNVRAAGFF